MAKRPSKQRSLPLEINTRVEVHPKTGAKVDVTRYTRGTKSMEERKYGDLESWILDGHPAREDLERIRDGLREQLQKQGYPTDLTPLSVNHDGALKPRTDETLDGSFPISFRRWTRAIEMVTEPLTIPRANAEYLDALVQVLGTKKLEGHLDLIAKLLGASNRYHGLLQNHLAYRGLKADRTRQEGPRALKRRSAAVRDVILNHARACWDKNTGLKSNIGNTAEIIASAVNDELLEKDLLLKGGRRCSVRVIRDHLRDFLKSVN